MSKKYQCTECQHVFNDHTAYCEDWQDKQKAFGCPECKAFYRKREKKFDPVQFCLLVFLVIPAFVIVFNSVIPMRLWGIIFFVVVMVIYMTYIGKQAKNLRNHPIEKIIVDKSDSK